VRTVVSAHTGGQNPREGQERNGIASHRFYDVVEVVDGDTVKVAFRGLVSVRIIGIDTPETVHPAASAGPTPLAYLLCINALRASKPPPYGSRTTARRYASTGSCTWSARAANPRPCP
jgi:endonuclease YncB( thermonuclease family)